MRRSIALAGHGASRDAEDFEEVFAYSGFRAGKW